MAYEYKVEYIDAKVTDKDLEKGEAWELERATRGTYGLCYENPLHFHRCSHSIAASHFLFETR